MEPAINELFQRMAKVEGDVALVEQAQGGHEVLCSQRYQTIIEELKSHLGILGKLHSRIWAVVVSLIGGLLLMVVGLIVYIFTSVHTG